MHNRLFPGLLLAACLTSTSLLAQTYVTPMMGGGQMAADMVHIDLYYDADANQLHAHVDDSYGTPQLRPLEPGYDFQSQQPYAVLKGKAYNAQYGWNAGGFFSLPPGAAIWIEQIDCTPGLETHSGWGRPGSYTPMFGTAGSSRVWKWNGVMVHNTYAFPNPPIGHLFADYHIFFADAITGSREGFSGYGDATVRLEWTAVPVENPLTFKFGATDQTNTAPLCFINADRFATNSRYVVSLSQTNEGPCASQYQCSIPMLVVPANTLNGGPATSHAAPGSRLELQMVALTGPAHAKLSFWEPGRLDPSFTMTTGDSAGTNRFLLSQSSTLGDPYGYIQGRQFAVTQPGLYCMHFRLVDTSTNGLSGAPIHTPSPLYHVYMQAGLTIESLTFGKESVTAVYGGQTGRTFYLERSSQLGSSASWQTVAGPLIGSNALQNLTDLAPGNSKYFFRLRATQ